MYFYGYTTTATPSIYNLKTLEELNGIGYVYEVKNPYSPELENQMIKWCENHIGPKYNNWNYSYISRTRKVTFTFYKKNHLLLFRLRWSEYDKV
jgi:hypothetical protein